jgi:hypothetical protein
LLDMIHQHIDAEAGFDGLKSLADAPPRRHPATGTPHTRTKDHAARHRSPRVATPAGPWRSFSAALPLRFLSRFSRKHQNRLQTTTFRTEHGCLQLRYSGQDGRRRGTRSAVDIMR